MIVRDLVAMVEQDYIQNQRKSLVTLRASAKHLYGFFSTRDIDEIRGRDIEEYKRARLAERAAPSTVNNELALLRRGFNLALEQEWITRAPRVRCLRVQNERQGFLEPEAFRRLERALRPLDAAVADLIEWLYRCGWRRSEAAGLLWAEVDLPAGLVVVSGRRTKSGHAHLVRLPEGILAILRRRDAARSGEFVFQRRGEPIRDFRAVWRRATAAAGCEGLKVHDLRRSFARRALLAGCGQKVAMDLGGWLTASIFRRYAITDEAALSSGLEKIDGLLGAEKKSFFSP